MSLDSIIEKIRALGTLPTDIARAAAPLVEAESKRTASAGTTPWGEAWKPRKADGQPALQNAAAAVTVTASGPKVVIALAGTSSGSAKVQAIQNASRQIIPKHTTKKGGGNEGIPPGIARAVEAGAQHAFTRTVGGA